MAAHYHLDRLTALRLQRLAADVHPRGPQVVVQLLTDVAARIGGQPAIIAALEELDAPSRRRRHRFPPRPLREVPLA